MHMKFNPENLRRDLDSIQDKHPEYDDDDAFTYWWMKKAEKLAKDFKRNLKSVKLSL